MAADAEIDALATLADQRRRAGMLKQMRRIREFNILSAYRRLFLDADGNLTPDAVTVLADVSKVGRLGFADTSVLSDAELRERGGRRAMALHIYGRLDLDGTRLRELAHRLRENDR